MSYDLLTIAATIFALILGLALHEFAHALMAHYLGDTTAQDQGRLTLNPLAHISLFTTLLLPVFLAIAHLPVFAAAKPVPFNPWAVRGGRWGAAAVAAAGPFTNLLIALVCSASLHAVHTNSTVPFIILGSIIEVNVGLFIFNLIPIPPLDGSRVLYAIVPMGVRETMDRIEQGGLIVIFAMILLLSYTPLGQALFVAISGLTNLLLPSSPMP